MVWIWYDRGSLTEKLSTRLLRCIKPTVFSIQKKRSEVYEASQNSCCLTSWKASYPIMALLFKKGLPSFKTSMPKLEKIICVSINTTFIPLELGTKAASNEKLYVPFLLACNTNRKCPSLRLFSTNGGHWLWPLNRIRRCKLSSCERQNRTKAKPTNKATDDCGLIREISNTSPDLSTSERIIFEILEVTMQLPSHARKLKY